MRVNHYNIRPVIDLYVSARAATLAQWAGHSIVDQHAPAARQLRDHARPGPDHARLLFGLGVGVGFAIVLVYLLIVVNFQSWLDPFIIISALPAALAGIVLFLFLTARR